MPLHDELVGETPRKYLISAGYHTPNGPLHLGHLGGPFLHGNVMARHLESLGHDVWQITGTDAHESYVLLSAVIEGKEPRQVSGPNHAGAHEVLEGFGMHQTAFADTGSGTLADDYARHSHTIAAFLLKRGRVTVRDVDMLRSRSTGRVIVGPFAVGECPACGADAAGTCCEECGVWFGPEKLKNTRARLPVDDHPEPVSVPTAYLRMSDSFNRQELAARFPARYLHLAEEYLTLNGPWLPLSHPLGWGVPWREIDALHPGTVHTSYVLGTYASNRVLRDLFHAATGLGDPFSRDSGVTTVLTSGLDAVLPCMFLQGLTDPELDWQPYQHHILNEFMLLDGEKFSTTRNHVITGEQYLASGLSPELFRLYAALITVPGRPADFEVSAFADFCRSFLAERLQPLVSKALAATSADASTWSERTARIAEPVLRSRIAALSLEETDLRAGAEALVRWVELGEQGLSGEDPGGWLKVLSWLAHPYLPDWSSSLWAATGLAGTPQLAVLDAVSRPDPHHYRPLEIPAPDRIAALLRPGNQPSGG